MRLKNLEEDFQDDRKYQSLEELYSKLIDIEKHIKRLDVMDSATEWEGKPVTGTADIHDQLTTMYKGIEGLQNVVARALKVVPGEQNPDIQKFKAGMKEGKYKSDAQRKAVHASKAEKLKEEPIQVREAGSPWTTTGKHPEKMTTDELWAEIAVFDEIQDRGETLSPKDMMRLDSLFAYMDTAEMNEAIKRKADSMMESAMWKAKKQ